jgi:PPK2 family polyphosphate:nucleotide phosphotransferase
MSKIKLRDISTRAPEELDKAKTKEQLEEIIEELDELQNLLYAEGKHSVLVVVQGMDASGKDGLTRNVFGHMNPQGVQVTSFKVPTAEEASHDFLWRVHEHAPAKGMIRIFNRSHYEDVLVTRVHGWVDDKTAERRMRAINDFERLLTEHAGTHILKCYLHISPEEQQIRLQERLDDPKKMWKYNGQDLVEAKKWDTYRKYYEAVFEQCSEVPWHIIAADQNWYKSFQVAVLLRDLLKGLNMQYPGLKQDPIRPVKE